MLFFWALYSSKNPEKMYHGFHKSINIEISEGSYDT